MTAKSSTPMLKPAGARALPEDADHRYSLMPMRTFLPSGSTLGKSVSQWRAAENDDLAAVLDLG